MKRSQAEFRLSCAVTDYLACALPVDVPYTHFPAGEYRTAATGARLKRMGLKPGWPDYLIQWRGRLVCIELKAAKGSVSEAQGMVGFNLITHGAIWEVCKSLEDVENVLRAAAIPLRCRIAPVAPENARTVQVEAME